ncbi:MAG: TonB-dependent receptor [Verrucomicrobiota bacterium JB022]|nr:TonB-dependent receptor [Verrucomicrobiota bacterium JB022]
MKSSKLLTSLALLSTTVSLFAQSSTAPAEGQVFELEEFIVTGEKLGRTLQETQTSVSFFSASTLQNTPVTSIGDVFKMSANTYAYDGNFSIRGIRNTGLTNSEGSELATVLLDGARVDSQMLTLDGLTLWDIEQVEILRGPQSTSQGRNSLAGAVVVTTKQPTFDWTGQMRATYAELETYQLAAAVGGPIVDDWLAFRISVDQQLSDGAITNTTRNEDDWDRTDSLTVRGKLLFAPKSWNGFTARLMYQQSESDFNDRAYAYANDWDGLFDRLAWENTRNEFDGRSRLASLIMEQPLWEGWQLSSTTSWSDFTSSSSYDGDRTPSGPGQDDLLYGYGYDNKNLSEELRILGRGHTWRVTGGLYLATEEISSNSSGPFFYTLPSAYPPLFGLPNPSRVLLDNQSDYAIETDNAALFFNGDWDIIPELTLTVGLRLDYEKKDRQTNQNVSLLQGFPDAVSLVDVPSLGIPAGTPADILIAGLAAQASSQDSGSEDFYTVLPAIGLTYNITEKMSAGISYSQGYRSGGVSFNMAQGRIVPFDPEFTHNFELSFRSQWLDDRVTLNANTFYALWEDQQISYQYSSDVYDSEVVNAAESEYYGFEIELKEWFLNGWSFYQNIGYTHTNFRDFNVGAVSLSDNEFPQAPHWTLGAGANYRHDSGWFGNASLTYIDNAWASEKNEPNLYLGERLLLDAKLGFSLDHWSVYVFGTNLLDDDYINRLWSETANAGSTYGAIVGRPRVIGVGFEANY